MGEHSIIIPESRDIDRESGLRVVYGSSSREFEAVGRSSSAGGVRRRTIEIDESTKYLTISNNNLDEKVKKQEYRRCRNRRRENNKKFIKFSEVTNFQEVVAKSSRLLKRISLLLVSLLGILISSVLTVSRGTLIVSSSRALVSLLVVALLRTTMAVPTVNTFSVNPTRSSDEAMMMTQHQRQQSQTVLVEQVNFESVAEATMRSRRRAVEDPSILDESGNDDFPPPLHQRESGLESRSRLGEAELDTIRRSIVEGLGLERIPDPSKANVSQTEYQRAHEEYLTRLQHSRAGKESRQRRLHTFDAAEHLPMTLVNRTRRSANDSAGDELQRRESNRHNGALYFPIEIPDDDFLIDHATLRFLLDPTGIPEDFHDVSIYSVEKDSWRLLSRHNILPVRNGPRWIELDVTETVSFWPEDDNLGLKLRFGSRNSLNYERQPKITHPALNVFTTTYSFENNDFRSTRRKRRATPEHLMSLHKGRRTECRGDNKKCCRHEMTVIFKDLKGFEFIVQPKNFDAGYCKGRCPPRYNPAHHHALLQSLIWKEDKRKAPRPCCAPSKLDELEILYFDENDPTKLKVSSWKNMKVLECACS